MWQQSKADFKNELLGHMNQGRNDMAISMINDNLTKSPGKLEMLLLHASEYGNSTIARHLISLGTKVDVKKYGKTALMWAVKSRNAETVKVLLESGAKMDIADATGKTAIGMAIDLRFKDPDIFHAFTPRVRVDVLAGRRVGGYDLQCAALSGDIHIVKGLVRKRKFDINARDRSGYTPLEIAARADDLRMVQVLIDNGADVNNHVKHVISPLLYAARNANLAMLQLLLERGADPRYENYFSHFTPLFGLLVFGAAVNSGEEFDYCVTTLLQHGAMPRHAGDIRVFFDWSYDQDNLRNIDHLIAHLTMTGCPTLASIEDCYRNTNDGLMIEHLKNRHNQYQQVLELTIFGKTSLLDLLAIGENKMRLRVRNETFVSSVEDSCSNHDLKKLCFYYYDTLMKRIHKAVRVVKLEDEAIPVIYDIIRSNEFYEAARLIVGYLEERDLQQLCLV